MDQSTRYREQAAYCAYLLRRALDPARRRAIQREREDWLMLAERQELWVAYEANGLSAA